MFNVPYRWLPRTIIPNIQAIFCNIITGIHNIYIWLPFIWADRDWDWVYMANIMEFKFRKMSKYLEHGQGKSSEKSSKQLLTCAELLKRIREDNMDINHNIHIIRMEEWQNMLGHIIGKNFMSWWD